MRGSCKVAERSVHHHFFLLLPHPVPAPAPPSCSNPLRPGAVTQRAPASFIDSKTVAEVTQIRMVANTHTTTKPQPQERGHSCPPVPLTPPRGQESPRC